MANLRCALYELRATDINITTSPAFAGVFRLEIGSSVLIEVGGGGADVEAEAAALDRLAEVASQAAARLRAASSGETR